jgi:hypothetical protein
MAPEMAHPRRLEGCVLKDSEKEGIHRIHMIPWISWSHVRRQMSGVKRRLVHDHGRDDDEGL